jgi:hypothetical protein
MVGRLLRFMQLQEAAGMRNAMTHFEQVPIEVVENILRQAAGLAGMLEASPAPVPELERPAVAKPTIESKVRV